MRTLSIRRGLAIGAIAITATAALSACTIKSNDVPEGKVVVTIDGAKSTHDDGHTITGTGKPISVETNKSKATITCTKGEAIDLLGAEGEVTIEGTCGDVSIISASQKITLEDAEELSVLGADNTISAGSVEALKVTGATNSITYTSSLREPELLGADNEVSKK